MPHEAIHCSHSGGKQGMKLFVEKVRMLHIKLFIFFNCRTLLITVDTPTWFTYDNSFDMGGGRNKNS